MAFEDQVDLQVLINLKTNAAGALEAQAAISGVKSEALAATPVLGGYGSAHKAAAAEERGFAAASKDAEKAVGDLGGPMSRLQGQLGGLAGVAGFGGVGLAALGVVAAVGGIALVASDAIKNTDRLEESTKALSLAYSSQGLSVKDNVAQVNTFLDTNKQFIADQYSARDAIAVAVRATGNQAEAMRVANDAIDVATLKQIPYADAVQILTRAIGGQARGLADLGISQKEINKLDAEYVTAQKDVTKETAAVEAATTKLKTAKQNLADKEAELAGKTKLTVAQQVELRKAHEAVNVASDNLTAAQKKLADAHNSVTTAGQHVTDVMTTVEAKTKNARNSTSDLTQANNRLHTDWQNFTTTIGPGVTGALTEVMKALDTGVGILKEFAEILGKIEAKSHVFQHIADFFGNYYKALGGFIGGAANVLQVIGSGGGRGQGYAAGGVITEPIWGIGASGRQYTFGESGPETVTPGTGGGGSKIVVNVMVQGSVMTDTGLAQAIAPKVRDELLRNVRNMPNLGLS